VLGTRTQGLQESIIQPRLVAALVLIAAGLLWAVVRGLEFYGANLAYDVDQPPLMLLLVGVWLVYRSRLK
jgi:cytochrome c oxidase subunit IV